MSDLAKLARAVAAAISENPEVTVPELAESLESDVPTVRQALDEFRVDKLGRVRHVGPGRGGGWTPEAVESDDEE